MRTTNKAILFAAIALSFFLITMRSPQCQAQNKPVAMKIGTYDSRVVTFAWSRSDFFKQILVKANQQSDSAEKSHDTTMIRELSVMRMSYQHLLHQMVFSNGSAGVVMAFIKDRLPELAKAEGVSVILSKWELNFSDPSIEIVDLTDQVSKLFNPGENIDRMAGEIKKQDPVPLEELTVETDMLDSYCRRFGKK